jgi:hypothetical protein
VASSGAGEVQVVQGETMLAWEPFVATAGGWTTLRFDLGASYRTGDAVQVRIVAADGVLVRAVAIEGPRGG